MKKIVEPDKKKNYTAYLNNAILDTFNATILEQLDYKFLSWTI